MSSLEGSPHFKLLPASITPIWDIPLLGAEMPHLPPRPTRLRANPMHRWGTVRVVRQYRYRTSPIPPSLGLVQGQLPVWSKWGLKRKIRIIIYFLSTKGKQFVIYKDNPHLQRSTDSLPSFGKQKGHRDHSLPQLLKSQTEPLNKRQCVRSCAFLCSSSAFRENPCTYLGERLFVWAGEVILVQVFSVEDRQRGGAGLLRSSSSRRR